MNLPQQLAQARVDLIDLEADTRKLEEALKRQEAELEATRRAARSGVATFEAVVKAQGGQDAARGLLAQHLQDVADTHTLVSELEAAVKASSTLERGREAREVMLTAETAFLTLAQRTEAQLNAALVELNALVNQHAAGRNSLRAALLQAVKTAHPHSDVYRAYTTPRPYIRTVEHLTGLTWLSEIEKGMTDDFAVTPSELSLGAFPLLSQVRERG